jgi:hypothetical protein
MTSKGHNKKRNTGLLYEFLVLCISEALVKDDKKRSNAALRIIRRHFKPGSELYKEYRLIHSLAVTTVKSEAVAASILQEAKAAARSHSSDALDREKSLLIGAINKGLNDENFYDKQVNEYKILATIQTLLNDWRTPGADLQRMAQYEDQLVKHLVTEKTQPVDQELGDASQPGASRLLMKVMMKKLNEKYAGVLSGEQKQLLRAYAFSTANDDPKSIHLKLQEIRDSLLQQIDKYSQTSNDTEYVNKKLTEVRQLIEEESLETVDDGTVTRFMLYTKLSSELTSEET